jgi:hypothetical protein
MQNFKECVWKICINLIHRDDFKLPFTLGLVSFIQHEGSKALEINKNSK